MPDSELTAELGSIATFLERVARTPELAPGALLELAAGDPDLEVTERIGAGGAGVVYLARDRKLDRAIAVKVQRFSGDDEADDALLAEARALARLSHPNVVTVFEVRQVDGHMLLLMELVRGPTLREWLAETPRDRDAVLAAFAGAGAGLLAAHRAGLIHRDFKPDNVIAGDDGRTRVVDFGLAGPEGDAARGGTPAYMAPEQARGDRVDARADQYAFCVSLLEAITGRPPTSGTLRAIAAAVKPRWLRRALERGLSTDPADRWPDMAALLAALRPPRRWPLVAAGLAAFVAATLALAPRGCAEPVGMSVDQTVVETAAVFETYERGKRQLAGGRLRQAIASLAAVYGRIESPALDRELGDAMLALEGYVRDVDTGDRAVDAIALSRDGKRLAIESNAITTMLDTETDRVIAEIEGGSPMFVDGDRYLLTVVRPGRLTLTRAGDGGEHRVLDLGNVAELATGGDVILVSAGGALRAYSTRDARQLFEVPAEGAPIGVLSVSADGQRMMVARPFLSIYDRSGALLRRSKTARLDAVARLAPGGAELAMIGRSSVAVYAVSDGALQRTLGVPPGLEDIRFSRDGTRALGVHRDRLCLASLAARRLIGCWPSPAPRSHAISDDLRVVASRGGGAVEIRDGESGRRRAMLAALDDGVAMVQISGDGSRVVTASATGEVRIWRGDLDNLDAEIDLPPGSAAAVHHGRLVVAGDRRLAIWDLDAPGAPLRQLASAGGRGNAAALSGDRAVAAWSARTWDVASGQVLADIEWWPPRASVALDRTGARLFACGAGVCRGFDARSGRRLWELGLAGPMKLEALPPAAITAHPYVGPGGDLVLAGVGVDLVVDPGTGAIRSKLERGRRSFASAVAFAGERRVAVSDGQRVTIADLDGQAIDDLAGGGPGLAAHPDGSRLLVPVDGGALLVDLRTGERRRLAIADRPLGGAAFSDDGALIALARGLGPIEIVDAASGRVIARRSTGAFTRAVHFTPAGRLVAITDTRALVWTLPRETRNPEALRRAVADTLGP